jgi:hypothetical protein
VVSGHLDSAPSCNAARLFAVVWDTLADVIGTAATATLLRRSARRAKLDELTVSREGFNYSYRLPPDWRDERPEPLIALRGLARELGPLLAELTGPVLLRRLASVPDLRRCHLFSEEQER